MVAILILTEYGRHNEIFRWLRDFSVSWRSYLFACKIPESFPEVHNFSFWAPTKTKSLTIITNRMPT